MVLGQFWIDLIGYIGSSAVAISAPLQLRKSWNRESTGDISWKWISSYLCGICLIFVYAVIEDLPPVWGPICLEISCSGMLLLLKIKYDIIQHKSYFVEMSTQTDPEDLKGGGLKAVNGNFDICNPVGNCQQQVYVNVTCNEDEEDQV
jgi:hypothetical protein